jgi:hypothetical protein
MCNDSGYFDRAYGNWLPNDPKCICDDCGEEVSCDEDLHEVYFEKYVCDSCYDNYVKCSYCKNEFNVDDMELVDNKNYCEDCYDEHIRVCVICGDEYFDEDEDVKICSVCDKDLV